MKDLQRILYTNTRGPQANQKWYLQGEYQPDHREALSSQTCPLRQASLRRKDVFLGQQEVLHWAAQ